MTDDLTEQFYLEQLERQRRGPRTEAERLLWLGIRQGGLIIIGAIEVFLGLERTREPKHKR